MGELGRHHGTAGSEFLTRRVGLAPAATPVRPFGTRRGPPVAAERGQDHPARWRELIDRARSAPESLRATVLPALQSARAALVRSFLPCLRQTGQAAAERLRAALARRHTRAVLAPIERPPAPAHPALRSWADEFRAVMVRMFAYLAAIGLLAAGAAELMSEQPLMLAHVEPLPRSPWVEVGRPHPAFTLSLPEFAEVERRYALLRHAGGGGRKDILSFGDAGADGPFASVEIYRPGNEPEIFADAMTEIAARLLRLDVSDDVKPAGTLDSKFGAVALVDFAIRSDHRQRRCLGFVRGFHQVRMQIAGWYCNPGPEVVDRGTVSCALDRLSALSSGNDPVLAQRFAQAELNRDFCRQKDPILYATPRRGDPVGAGARLRGRQSAR